MEKRIYGAWISRDEFIPVINEEEHAEIAYGILRERFPSPNWKDFKNYSVYRIMYRLGYIRLVFYRQEYNLEFWRNLVPNSFQKSYIDGAESVDLTYVYYNREYPPLCCE